MTDADLDVVERYVSDLWRQTKEAPRPPIALSSEFDRIEVDLSRWADKRDADILLCRLAQAMGSKGYNWDFWFCDLDKDTLCVSYKEVDE